MGNKTFDELLLRHMLNMKYSELPARADVYRQMRRTMQELLTWLVDADSYRSPFDFRIFTCFVSDMIYYLQVLETLEEQNGSDSKAIR